MKMNVLIAMNPLSLPPHTITSFSYLFNNHFFSPAQLEIGFTISDLLDKPWSQVFSFPPALALISIVHRAQLSHFSLFS